MNLTAFLENLCYLDKVSSLLFYEMIRTVTPANCLQKKTPVSFDMRSLKKKEKNCVTDRLGKLN